MVSWANDGGGVDGDGLDDLVCGTCLDADEDNIFDAIGRRCKDHNCKDWLCMNQEQPEHDAPGRRIFPATRD